MTSADGRSRDAFARECARLGPRLMRDLGLTDLQAAGLLGNLGHESGGFRFLQEIAPVVTGSRGGWGLAQWTGPRRNAMEAWCRARALDRASIEANYGYLCTELRTTESAALAALKRAPTLEAATETVCLRFERPGVVSLDRRLAWAQRALAAIRAGLAEERSAAGIATQAGGRPLKPSPDEARSGLVPSTAAPACHRSRAGRVRRACPRREAIMIRIILAALALAGAAVLSAALADGAASGGALTIPWGDWLVAVLQPASAVLVPIAAAAVTAGVARVAPWAASVLTRERIEAAIRAGADYGQNAIAGAAKGRTVAVELGSAVVVAGARHVLDTAPAGVVRKAGGAAGIATRIFRSLPLDEQASVGNVLLPALAQLREPT